jgi:hypothetical protein
MRRCENTPIRAFCDTIKWVSPVKLRTGSSVPVIARRHNTIQKQHNASHARRLDTERKANSSDTDPTHHYTTAIPKTVRTARPCDGILRRQVTGARCHDTTRSLTSTLKHTHHHRSDSHENGHKRRCGSRTHRDEDNNLLCRPRRPNIINTTSTIPHPNNIHTPEPPPPPPGRRL